MMPPNKSLHPMPSARVNSIVGHEMENLGSTIVFMDVTSKATDEGQLRLPPTLTCPKCNFIKVIKSRGLLLYFTQVTGPAEVSLLNSPHPVKCRTEEDFTGQAP